MNSSDRNTPSLEEVQRDFPQLKVMELVGAGGMGLVYRARQIKLGRQVALKILLPEFADDPAFAERFLREAQALAKLDHPNVVKVHDFGESMGRYYLLMEYVDGAPLRELIEKGKMRLSRVLQLFPEVCAGLAYAHEQGVVHRDIKPENILIDRYGEAKIADFGLARLLDQDDHDWRLTRASQIMGTPQYMAPEQVTSPRDVDHRADIYSVGVVLYEMLTGAPPVGRFDLPSERVHVDKAFDGIVLKAMERAPEDRYQLVRELGDRVAFLAGKGLDSPDALASSEQQPRRGSNLPTARVPFGNSIDPWYTSKSLKGRVWLEGNDLMVEWCKYDDWGVRQLPPIMIKTPLEELEGVEYRPRWWGQGEITLKGTRMEFGGDYPQVRPGQIRLMVAHDQKHAAGELVSGLKGLLAALPMPE